MARANGPGVENFLVVASDLDAPDVPVPLFVTLRRLPMTGLPSSDFRPGVDFLEESPDASTLAVGGLRLGFPIVLLELKVQ